MVFGLAQPPYCMSLFSVCACICWACMASRRCGVTIFTCHLKLLLHQFFCYIWPSFRKWSWSSLSCWHKKFLTNLYSIGMAVGQNVPQVEETNWTDCLSDRLQVSHSNQPISCCAEPRILTVLWNITFYAYFDAILIFRINQVSRYFHKGILQLTGG